ncbi:MAG: hypothetical protein ABJN26_14320 [Stappiaceae bacterium]
MATGILLGVGGALVARGYFKESTVSYVFGGVFVCIAIGTFFLRVHLSHIIATSG